MKEDKIGRRELVKRTIALAVVAAAPAALTTGCGSGELSCDDTSALSAADRDARRTAGYSDRGTAAARQCSSCNFFTAGGANACGTCTVVRGSINPAGTCNLFVARS